MLTLVFITVSLQTQEILYWMPGTFFNQTLHSVFYHIQVLLYFYGFATCLFTDIC